MGNSANPQATAICYPVTFVIQKYKRAHTHTRMCVFLE